VKTASTRIESIGIYAAFIPTTNSNHGLPVCENALNRDIRTAGPGEKWVAPET
jgi:hypothetical protein